MPRLKLSYFDFNGGRGEAARLALSIGRIDFEDHRIPVSQWPSVRERTPFHAVPVLEIDGEELTQSNAINRYVGRLAGLYPDDAREAARCDEIMDSVEDIVTQVVATFGIQDAEELRSARGALVEGRLPVYLGGIERLLPAGDDRYFAADQLSVADLKVLVWVQSLRAGILDHVPVDLCDRVAPRLVDHSERLRADPAIAAYYEAH